MGWELIATIGLLFALIGGLIWNNMRIARKGAKDKQMVEALENAQSRDGEIDEKLAQPVLTGEKLRRAMRAAAARLRDHDK